MQLCRKQIIRGFFEIGAATGIGHGTPVSLRATTSTAWLVVRDGVALSTVAHMCGGNWVDGSGWFSQVLIFPFTVFSKQ